MKKLKLLVPFLTACLMLVGCNKDNANQNPSNGSQGGDLSDSSGNQSGDSSDSSGGQTTSLWDESIHAEMMLYFGEDLPYVALNQETLYHELNDEYAELGMYYYYVGDDNETNLMTDYVALLLQSGFTQDEDYFGDPIYVKTTANGTEIEVYAEYYEASADYNAGNEICVYFESEEDFSGPITIEGLLEQGFEKNEGWPATMVADLIADSEVEAIAGVNLEGDWYYLADDTDYEALYLVTEGSFATAMNGNFEAAGMEYDAQYQAYYSENIEIGGGAYEQDGFTIVNIINFGSSPIVPVGDGDVLNSEFFNLDGTTVYSTYTATGAYGTSYEAQCANGNNSIQIRSNNSNSGVIGHSSDSYACVSLTFTFESHTQANRKIDIYGGDEAFTIADMYGDSVTKLGDVTYDGETTTVSFAIPNGGVEYIGFRSDSGAIYLSSVVVEWSPVYID